MIDKPFLKSLNNKIEECSTIAQLDALYNLFKRLNYSKEVRELFLVRCKFLMGRAKSASTIDYNKCKALLEELMVPDPIELKFENKGEFEIMVTCYSKEGSILNDVIGTVISGLLLRAGGRKKEVARILGITEKELNQKINNPTIKKMVGFAKQELKKKL